MHYLEHVVPSQPEALGELVAGVEFVEIALDMGFVRAQRLVTWVVRPVAAFRRARQAVR